jgi:hypothetical protein
MALLAAVDAYDRGLSLAVAEGPGRTGAHSPERQGSLPCIATRMFKHSDVQALGAKIFLFRLFRICDYLRASASSKRLCTRRQDT